MREVLDAEQVKRIVGRPAASTSRKPAAPADESPTGAKERGAVAAPVDRAAQQAASAGVTDGRNALGRPTE